MQHNQPRRLSRAAAIALCLTCISTNAWAVLITTTPVGNLGNASDTLSTTNNPTNLLFGSVNYAYQIGNTEVTNAQYVDFLNAKAKTNDRGLYAPDMTSGIRGGITQSGSSGSFTYSVRPNMGDKPVVYVNFFDAVRFANWMHNGQGTGNTETGSYTLLGPGEVPTNANFIVRNSNATWVVPSENEWYKAAFYDPTLAAGAGGYWDYATRSNITPASALSGNGPVPPPGNITNPGLNVANQGGANWNSVPNNLTTVATAGNTSYYGTSDQAGNVWEWNESVFSGSFRGLRGGSWFLGGGNMHAAARGLESAGVQNDNVGFRLAFVPVPEPSSAVLAMLAVGLAWIGRRRFQSGVA